MKKHITKANHNEDFHNCIVDNFDSLFHDWKITVLFYSAIHYLKALAVVKGKDIGNSHFDIARNINPNGNSPTMALSRNMWNAYNHLYQTSRSVRYDGIVDQEYFEESLKGDYEMCTHSFEIFKGYILAQISSYK